VADDARDAPAGHGSTYHVGEPLPLVLVLRDLEQILGLSATRAWRLWKQGEFRQFELEMIGNRPRFSGARVQAWLDGHRLETPETNSRRYFTSARRQRP
jgi:predicted DNA-binding transcriptional regulator AlpA